MRKTGRWFYVLFSFVFLVCTLVQFYFAGMAIFSSSSYWLQHVLFVHYFGSLPILMLLSIWIGKGNKWDYFIPFILFFLIFLMYFTANVGIAMLRSLHPVIGVIMVLVSSFSVYRSLYLATFAKKNGKLESGLARER